MKRPAFLFYPGDWQSDHKLRACSPVARCLWMELLCIFHQSDMYGCLPSFLLKQISSKDLSKDLSNGLSENADLLNQMVNHPVNYEVNPLIRRCLPIVPTLAQMTAMRPEDVRAGLEELFRQKIPDVTEDGLIYSKRMLRDRYISQVRAIAGKKGGNPAIVKTKTNLSSGVLLKQKDKQEVKQELKQPDKQAVKQEVNHELNPLVKPIFNFKYINPPSSPPAGDDQHLSEQPTPPQTPPAGGHSGDFFDDGSVGDQQTPQAPDATPGAQGEVIDLFGPDAFEEAGEDEGDGGADPDAPAGDPQAARKRGRAPAPSVTFRTWLQRVTDADEDAIAPDDPVFAYAETAGIPGDFIALHWHEFKAHYLSADKRYKDWRAVFRKSVRGNWFRLWVMRDGQTVLTTVGQQAMRVMQAEADRAKEQA